MNKFEIFERAFSSGGAGCREECKCGKEYFDGYASYDWEEGELDRLRAAGAIEKDYCIGTIIIDGDHYVAACDCWHKEAEWMIRLIEDHKFAFVKYLQLEKERKQKEFQQAINPSDDLVYNTGPDRWRAMEESPKGQTVEVLLADEKTIVKAHWASDLSGEEQPPFEGWFTKCGEHSYSQIQKPISWREIPAT